MTGETIYGWINEMAPFETQESWDNSGFLCGDRKKEVSGVLVTLDVTMEAVNMAIEMGLNLILSHHPLIFKPVSSVEKGSVLYGCITNHISVISAHTNLDIAAGGVNDVLADRLQLNDRDRFSDGICMKGSLPAPMDADDLTEYVKEKLGAPVVRRCGEGLVKVLGLCSGSGGEFYSAAAAAGCDAFLTGDVKHNLFVEAKDEGFILIDGGHFATEQPVVSKIAKDLEQKFPGLRVVANEALPPFCTL